MRLAEYLDLSSCPRFKPHTRTPTPHTSHLDFVLARSVRLAEHLDLDQALRRLRCFKLVEVELRGPMPAGTKGWRNQHSEHGNLRERL
eukprot:208226-Chlamydomonas_euryale.AAC.2